MPSLRTVVGILSALSIAFGAAITGVALLLDGGSGAVGLSPKNTATPVLSIRRVPTLLRSSIGAQQLQVSVAEILANPNLTGSEGRSCVLVESQGRVVEQVDADLAVVPASTMKLLTATAALSTMAPTLRFMTDVRATSQIANGTLDGDLWLVGGGDPLLESLAYTATRKHPKGVATSLDALADAVVATGLKTITGNVVGDDRLFDDVRVTPTWKRSYVSDGEVGPIGGLIVDDNFTVIGAGGSRLAAQNVPADAAGAFQRLLEARGVTVARKALGAERTAPAAATTAPIAVATATSVPLADVVAEMLRESDNTTAEVLLKHVSLASGTSPGSTLAGAAALRRSLSLGGARPIDVAALKMVDGSGLDRGDRASCRLLLGAVRDQPETGPLIDGLAVMGVNGTLRERLRGTDAAGKVKAKTGTLNGVSALVGVTTGSDGRRVSFALVFNGLVSTASGVTAGDALATALVAFPVAPDAASLAPVGS
jgi:serine-type D-Ala-D-Ala carboxypeptidase/endopeptidase (penicillin-binding protein 4)